MDYKAKLVEDWFSKYTEFSAELDDITMRIITLKDGYDPDAIPAVDTTRDVISPTNAVSSTVEQRVIPYVDRLKKLLERKVTVERYLHRMDNAMSVLTADEKTIVQRCVIGQATCADMLFSERQYYRLKRSALDKMAGVMYGEKRA